MLPLSIYRPTLTVQDRNYCENSGAPTIYAASLQLFRDYVLLSPTIASEEKRSTILAVVVHAMLDSIRKEREGDTLDKSMLKHCSYMLESMYSDSKEADDQKLYTQCFEPEFLAASEVFYKLESDDLIREASAGSYCRHAKSRLLEERDRCRSTLCESTTEKIEAVVTDQLVKTKIKDLVEMDSGVSFMIDNDRVEELALMFELGGRVDPNVPELKKALEQRILQIGKEINSIALAPPTSQAQATAQQTLAAIKWVEDVLSLKDKIDRIWEHSFAKSQPMQTAITHYFSEFINAINFSRAAEYVSLFIDDNMKKGIKDKTAEEINEILQKAITLLRYVSDKDMFEVYYKKHLSRRLLTGKSVSAEAETLMVMKMKIEMGNSFTTKIEAMFKDMLTSADLTKGFAEYMADSVADVDDVNAKPIELSISMLTYGTWPHDAISRPCEQSNAQRVLFPKRIERLMDRFKRYYLLQHNGRALTWHAGMGTADMKVRFPAAKRERSYDINVPTISMIVLSLFSETPRGYTLTCEEIQRMTRIPMDDLTRNLQSLALNPKTRLLRKEPHSRDVHLSDNFTINELFTSKFHKFKIGVVAAANRIETDRERLQTEKATDETRSLVTEAVIVRIMKYVSH
jgi:cullin 3